MDDDGLGEHPTCPNCGTLTYVIDGSDRCRGCGWAEPLPDIIPTVDVPPREYPPLRGIK